MCGISVLALPPKKDFQHSLPRQIATERQVQVRPPMLRTIRPGAQKGDGDGLRKVIMIIMKDQLQHP